VKKNNLVQAEANKKINDLGGKKKKFGEDQHFAWKDRKKGIP